MKRQVYLIDTQRSAFARAGKGCLVATRMDKLAVQVLAQLVKRNAKIDYSDYAEFGLGQVFHADELLNMGSAQIAHLAGLPYSMSKFELNRQCGSSMEVVQRIVQAMHYGMYDTAIAMGIERMQRNMNFLPTNSTRITRINPDLFKYHSDCQSALDKDFIKYFNTDLPDAVLNSAPLCTMLQTAQNVADMYKITRQQCDDFALKSHQKYQQAFTNQLYQDEICPLEIEPPVFSRDGELDLSQRSKPMLLNQDECFRQDLTIEQLRGLNTIAGIQSYCRLPLVITPGNACPTNDGVSGAILMSSERMQKLEIEPLAEIVAMGVAGIKPQIMGVGPVIAIHKALKQAKLSINDIDRIEFNEAFASQVIATMQELKFDMAQVNVNGGSLAIGHPLGATGIRLLGTLARELRRSKSRYGIAAQCIGAGMGIATVLRNPYC